MSDEQPIVLKAVASRSKSSRSRSTSNKRAVSQPRNLKHDMGALHMFKNKLKFHAF